LTALTVYIQDLDYIWSSRSVFGGGLEVDAEFTQALSAHAIRRSYDPFNKTSTLNNDLGKLVGTH
jgi:hypothetical protein